MGTEHAQRDPGSRREALQRKCKYRMALGKVNILRRKMITQTKVFARFKNTKRRKCVLGKDWLILKIMRKQLLLACSLRAKHNAGHFTDIFLTLLT